jgi:hypothetical protein
MAKHRHVIKVLNSVSERDAPYSTDVDVAMTQILSEGSCFLIVFVIYHSQSTAKALKRYARIPTFIDQHYHWLCSLNYQPIKVRACLYVVLVGLNPCFRYSPTRGCCSGRKENLLYRCTSYPYRHPASLNRSRKLYRVLIFVCGGK